MKISKAEIEMDDLVFDEEHIGSKYYQISSIVDEIKKDYAMMVMRKSKAPAKRVRQAMLELSRLCKDVRVSAYPYCESED